MHVSPVLGMPISNVLIIHTLLLVHVLILLSYPTSVFLSLPFRMKESFVVSGSQDCTIKVWDLPETILETDGDMFQLTARVTEKAHDKV
jgi:WD40 repeat protein